MLEGLVYSNTNLKLNKWCHLNLDKILNNFEIDDEIELIFSLINVLEVKKIKFKFFKLKIKQLI